MKEFNLKSLFLKKKEIKLTFILLVVFIAVITLNGIRKTYCLPFDGNMMNTFPDVIKNNAEKIYEVYFQDLSQDEITSRYNKATIKADLTYNSTGKVYGWLEELETDKYKLIIASTGKIYLNTGYSLFAAFDYKIGRYISYFKNATKIDFLNVDTSRITDMSYMFYGYSNLKSLDLSNFDTSRVTTMKDMFSGCSSLTSLNLSSFDTSKVTSMSYMFQSCSGLTSLDVSNFNTSKVTEMRYMFSSCSGLTSLDVGNFDTSKVTVMYAMFSFCRNLTYLDLTNFNTSNVTDMGWMFYECRNLIDLDLSNFDTSKVTNMIAMFYSCSNLKSLDLGDFDTSKIEDMHSIFENCNKLMVIVKKNNKILFEFDLKVSFKRDIGFNNVYSNKNVLKNNDNVFITGDFAYDDTSKKYNIAVLGDTNGDGKLDLKDIMKVANYVYKDKNSLSGSYLIAADYNLDNSYNIQDIMKMANTLYKGGI